MIGGLEFPAAESRWSLDGKVRLSICPSSTLSWRRWRLGLASCPADEFSLFLTCSVVGRVEEKAADSSE